MKILDATGEYDTGDAFWNSLNSSWWTRISASLFGTTVMGEPGRYYKIWRGSIYRTALS